jgi:membrane protein
MRWSYRLLRMGVLIVEGFIKSEVFLLAAALTYQIIFALVPLLVVMLAVGKNFLGDQVQKFILQYTTSAVQGDVGKQIDEFIKNVNATAIGVVGFVALLYTSISLLSTIEKVFNKVWGIKTPRTLLRRFTVYWTFLTVSPILLAASLSMTTFVQSNHLYVWLTGHIPFFGRGILLLTPYVMAWILFTGFYIFMPNTRVHPGAAFVGGLIAGSAWEGMKGVYFWYNTHVITAYKFYGSVGAIPVFLLWVYLSWIIVLFGAEVVFAVQHVNTYKREIEQARLSAADRDRLALVVATEIVRAFVKGEPPLTGEEVAERLNSTVRAVNEVLFELSTQGILREVALPARKEPGFLPARDPGVMTARDVLAAVRSYGDPATLPDGERAGSVYALIDEAESHATAVLSRTTIRQLAMESSSLAPGPALAGNGNGDGAPAIVPPSHAVERPSA